ncbi:hypothetical protein BMR1_03g00266 [Babesia microti strain RI]|uniref:Uncharacterized protein n=1 Tax=Babesia microti (strain RI) TaxID=1133968 RepID=A0A1R4AB45_BABMR|nr:hypothetical protein BMR1_03g00266 [Babesia microti strain RI]SJK86217.1 hypothetical protein BMR1_03g00266 [Babesia microti strain RI]|eukprot:XP_012648665.2 hypothetical protein BMR1_03g00266 [Babesia microti strain RI]
MVEVGYSDSDNEVPDSVEFSRQGGLSDKLVKNEVDSLESPRFGITRGQSQDSFTTQCSTPRAHDKHSQLCNHNHHTSVGFGIPECELDDCVDPFDKIMSQNMRFEQLNKFPEVLISDHQQWNSFIHTLPPSFNNITPTTKPLVHQSQPQPHLGQISQLKGEMNQFIPFSASDYPIFTSAIDRNWDSLLNLSTPARTDTNSNNNMFKWWCNDQQFEPHAQSGQIGQHNMNSFNRDNGTTTLKKLKPRNEKNTTDIGVNTDITSIAMDSSENRLKIMTQLNEQYQQRVKHIITQNDDIDGVPNDLVDEEGKEFVAAVREHLIKVHQQMEALMLDNLKFRGKIDKSAAFFDTLYETITVLKEQTNSLVQENSKLAIELKIARQDKAYAVEYCKSSNEALKQTSLEKDKILAEFNNIANSKVVLEKEFKETIYNMQSMKSKLVEWQSKVNNASPQKKSVRFLEHSDFHIAPQSHPISTSSHTTTPTVCKSVQEQLQSYQLNCGN